MTVMVMLQVTHQGVCSTWNHEYSNLYKEYDLSDFDETHFSHMIEQKEMLERNIQTNEEINRRNQSQLKAN